MLEHLGRVQRRGADRLGDAGRAERGERGERHPRHASGQRLHHLEQRLLCFRRRADSRPAL